jgi:hypothetical protein
MFYFYTNIAYIKAIKNVIKKHLKIVIFYYIFNCFNICNICVKIRHVQYYTCETNNYFLLTWKSSHNFFHFVYLLLYFIINNDPLFCQKIIILYRFSLIVVHCRCKDFLHIHLVMCYHII